MIYEGLLEELPLVIVSDNILWINSFGCAWLHPTKEMPCHFSFDNLISFEAIFSLWQ